MQIQNICPYLFLWYFFLNIFSNVTSDVIVKSVRSVFVWHSRWFSVSHDAALRVCVSQQFKQSRDRCDPPHFTIQTRTAAAAAGKPSEGSHNRAQHCFTLLVCRLLVGTYLILDAANICADKRRNKMMSVCYNNHNLL